jgi:hypothetical protein
MCYYFPRYIIALGEITAHPDCTNHRSPADEVEKHRLLVPPFILPHKGKKERVGVEEVRTEDRIKVSSCWEK